MVKCLATGHKCHESQTHTLLNRNTTAWVWYSYSRSQDTPINNRTIVHTFWLLRVIWLNLRLPRWSPQRGRGKLEHSRDRRGSQSFNHTMSKSSQYLFYNTTTDYLSPSYTQHSYALFRSTDAWLIGFEVGKKTSGCCPRHVTGRLLHGKRLSQGRQVSSKRYTYHVSCSKPMKRQIFL